MRDIESGMGTEVGVEVESVAKVELKICERCGGLWLRPAHSDWIYCRLCKQQVNELPKPRQRKNAASEAMKTRGAAATTDRRIP